MKFHNGEWLTRPGVKIYNCEQIRQVTVDEDGRCVRLFAVPYRQDERSIDGPALEIGISSPQKDMLRLKAVHFKGCRKKMPAFELDEQACPLEVSEDKDLLRISSGNVHLCIHRTPPCTFTYYYGEEKLTNVGERFGSPMLCFVDAPEGPFMMCQLQVDVGEKIYGLGERFTPFVRNGQTVDIWNEDGGTSSELSYKNIPFYLSSNRYGVLVNDTGPVSFEVCSEAVTKVQFSVPGQSLDFVLIGAPDRKGVLSRYTALVGRPALPPAWTFGLWLSSSFTTSYDEETVRSFVEGMKERDIPLRVFHFDCFWMSENEWCGFEWDRKMFPDPQGMLKRMHEMGLKVCVWINPYLSQHCAAFDEAAKEGYLLRKPDGDIWQWDLWQAGLAVVDFTNPRAVQWYQDKLRRLMAEGVDCFKTDFGERIPTDVVYYDGSDPVRMHNYYTYLYNRAVFEVIQEVKGEKEAVVFARSATVGGQKFPVHWGGDCNSTYVSMAESLRAGLSLCLSGFGYWSHDIGGFEGTAPADVYKRWLAFGLLSTHSRLHGSSSYRVPWLFGEEAVEVCRKFAKLKNTLMPYLYSLAVENSRTGIPVMRPMLLEFENDPGCEDLDRQYMLGDSLLVAPVMRSDGYVDYYLPKGHWTHLLSGETVEGNGWRRDRYDFFSLPLFVREGTILPIGAFDDRPDYDYLDGIALRFYNFSDGSKTERNIYDINGQLAFHVTALRIDDTIFMKVGGAGRNFITEQHGTNCLLLISKEGDEP